MTTTTIQERVFKDGRWALGRVAQWATLHLVRSPGQDTRVNKAARFRPLNG
jgi:hypothetical protein